MGGVSADLSPFSSVGGLVGYSDHGNIETSYATGSVFASGASSIRTGGLVGYLDHGNIETSYAMGSVFGSGATAASVHAGGLVGREYYSTARIADSYATGSVSASDATNVYAGGLVGSVSVNAGTAAGVFDKQGTGQDNGVGDGNSANVTAKTNAEMISADITGLGNNWEPIEGYYPQIKDLSGAFPEASAFSVVPVRFSSADIASNDTSRNVTWLFKVPLSTPEPVSAPLSWNWTPTGALRGYGINTNDELRLGPVSEDQEVLLTVTAEGGKMKKSFRLRANNANYTYDPSHDPYGDKPVAPDIPYYGGCGGGNGCQALGTGAILGLAALLALFARGRPPRESGRG
jgi:hypothetical protein